MTLKEAQRQANILEVNIDSTSTVRVLRQVRDYVSRKHKFYIVTPNPEQILQAQDDLDFKEILNEADISVPDAIGLVMAEKYLSMPRVKGVFSPVVMFAEGILVGLSAFLNRDWLFSDMEVVRGRELFVSLVDLANKKGWTVVLVGDRHRSAQKAVEKLSRSYKSVELIGVDGPNLDSKAKPRTKSDLKIEGEAIAVIKERRPELIFVGFGAPKQEKWLMKHWKHLPVGGAMVVGKSFQWESGEFRVSPKWMADFGLEWLWRLLTGSTNFERIVNAFPVFAWKIYLRRLQDKA